MGNPSMKITAVVTAAVLLVLLLVVTVAPTRAHRFDQAITLVPSPTPVPSATSAPSATAPPSGPTPNRPTLTPTPIGGAPAPDASASSPSLSGFVWVNGDPSRPASGVPIRFAGAGFDLATSTDASGYYQFDQLGQDIGFLNVAGNGTSWRASVKDVAVSPRPGVPLRVNFSGSEQSSPARGPVQLSMSASPTTVKPGQSINLVVKAHNASGQKLSGVWITHVLPDGLTVAGLTVDRGDTLSYGPLAMANVGDMAPGDTATFTIVATAPEAGVPEGTWPAGASLFSREGVAAQASVAVRGSGGAVVLPVTGSGAELLWIGLALLALAVGAGYLRRRRVSA